MTLSQGIMLYGFIIPIILLMLISIYDGFIEEYKESKKLIKRIKKQNRKLNEEIARQDFYRSLGWR